MPVVVEFTNILYLLLFNSSVAIDSPTLIPDKYPSIVIWNFCEKALLL